MENYFNYFTEIEEYFWKKRGTAMMVSTLDWALIESWKESGIPLEAVLKGIDRSFEKYHAKRKKAQRVNSLAYCHQEVLQAAEDAARAGSANEKHAEAFPREELVRHLERNAKRVSEYAEILKEQGREESAGNVRQAAASLREMMAMAAQAGDLDLEDMERRLTVLEEKMLSTLMQGAAEEDLVAIRREMDGALGAARQKMTAEQAAQLQKQYLNRKLLEKGGLSRLSLFYM